MTSKILDIIKHYQKSIEESAHNDTRLLHCIEKLYKLPVTVEHLQVTGVGKTVNNLRKNDKEVGVAAKALVTKWKAMVAAEEKNAESDEDNKRTSYDNGNDDDDQDENGNPVNLQNNQTSNNYVESSDNTQSNHHEKRHYSSTSSSSKSHNISSTGSTKVSSTGKDYSSKRKHYNDDRTHHKKIKNDLEIPTKSTSCKINSGSSSTNSINGIVNKNAKEISYVKDIKQEILDDYPNYKPLDIKQEIIKEEDFDGYYENENYMEFDDDGEKLVIDDRKIKIEEESDNELAATQVLNFDKKHHIDSIKNSSGEDLKDRGRKTANNSNKSDDYKTRKENINHSNKDRKESSSRSSKDKKESNNYHSSKSKYEDDKKKSKYSSSSKNHHSSSNSKSSLKDEGRSKKEKSDDKQNKRKDKKEHYSHHNDDANKETSSSSISKNNENKHKRKLSAEDSATDSGIDKKISTSNNSSSKSNHNKSKHKRKLSAEDSATDSSSKSSPAKATSSSKNTKSSKPQTDGIDSSMGTSFEEALGFLSPSATVKNSKKNKSKSSSTSVRKSEKDSDKTSHQSTSSSSISDKTDFPPAAKADTPDLLTSKVKLEPLDPTITLELPTISPNYKPMPLNPTVMECVFKQQYPQRRTMTDDEALAAGISSKTIRTKVYSGARTGQIHQVPSLFDLCIWVLQKNLDALEYTGGVPFDVLKPVLELANPIQLINFEHYNPYLMEDTDELWEKICSRHCKGAKRQEMETWRELYARCEEERAERFNKLTKHIKQTQLQITQPIKKTQLAYVDSMVKPPRNVQRKQDQFGTSNKKVTTPAARVASLSNLAPNIAKVPVRVNPNEKDTAQASAHMRPKKAPLMQKVKQLMKDDDDEFTPSKGLKIVKSVYTLRNGFKEGIDIDPSSEKKSSRISEKFRLWQRRCFGLEYSNG